MFSISVDDELQLALVEASFAKYYYKIVTNQKKYLGKWLTWPPLADSEDFFLTYITKALREYAENQTMVCAIFYHDELVGNVSLHNIDQDSKSAEIGYWISKDFQGKGIVSRVVKKIIEVGRQKYALESFYIEAAMENTASRAVCERLGATLVEENAKPSELHGREVLHAIYRIDFKK